MIVPVGKNKHQVNQGGMKHESLLDDNDFSQLFLGVNYNKLAADFSKITDPQKTPDPAAVPQEETPTVPDDLQSAMNQGGLKEPPQVDEEALGGLEGPAQPEGQTGPSRGGVTDEGQKVTRMVQKALGLDPTQGWAGTTTFKNDPDGRLSAITIGLTRQPGKLVQKV